MSIYHEYDESRPGRSSMWIYNDLVDELTAWRPVRSLEFLAQKLNTWRSPASVWARFIYIEL